MSTSIRTLLSPPRQPRHGRPLFTASLAIAIAATLVAGWAGARSAIPAAAPAPRAVHAQAPASSGPAYALPVLNFFHQDDICESWVAVQNAGDRPGQPVIAFLIEPSTTGTIHPSDRMDPWPGIPGQVSCGGLLRPGAQWNFYGAQVATGGRSGVVLSLDDTTLTAAGADTSAGDDVVGGRLCELIRTRVADDPARWRAFVAAWQSGAAWEGVPLGRIAGPPLNIHVHRSCPGQKTPGTDITDAYAAPRIVPSSAGSHRAVFATLSRPVIVRTRPRGGGLYVQNTGAVSGTFRVRYQAAGACAPPPPAETLVLGPLDAADFDLVRAPEGWRGQAIVEGDAPFVLVGEPAVDDLCSAEAVVSTPVGTDAGDHGPLAAVVPLVAGAHRLTVDIVNTGRSPFAPRVTVYGPAGRTGAPIASPISGGSLCPGGNWTATHITVADGRLDAYLVWIEGPPAGGAGAFIAKVQVEAVRAGGSNDPGGAVRASYDITARPANGTARMSDIRPIGLPATLNDLQNSGIGHVIAVARTGAGAGRMDYVVQLYDRNGLVDRICRTVTDAATDVVDLSAGAGPMDGTKAAAVVAAVGWDGAEPPGDLAVTAVWVKGTQIGVDLPGDAHAAVAGTPLDAAWSQVAAAAPCGPQAEPAPPPILDTQRLSAALFVPVVTSIGQDAVCTAEVRVTNEGTMPSEIVRILWGQPGFCEPDCAPPTAIRCSPLIAPGAGFTFVEQPGPNSAVMLSLDGRTLDALGIAPGDDRTAAAVLCASTMLAESCNGWRRLWLAWQTGGTFAGLPLDRVVGGSVGAVVTRTCPETVHAAASGPSSYPAVQAAEALAGETQPDRFVYSAADIRIPRSERPAKTDNVVAYIQNAGTRCAAITFMFVSSTAPAGRCDIATLSPGETYQLDARDCIEGPWHGTLVFSSDQPLAIAIDHIANPMSSSVVDRGALPPPTVDPLGTSEATSTSPRPTATATPTGVATPTQAPTSIPSPTENAQERLFLPQLLRQPQP